MEKQKNTKPASEPRKDLMQVAKELRSKASGMNDADREAAYSHAMQLIYGGNGGTSKAKVSRT